MTYALLHVDIWSQEDAPASAGPSKNAAKKAEKAAKKAAAKNAKPVPTAAASTPASTRVAPAPAPKAAASSAPSMYLSCDGPGPLKCVTAALFFGVTVDAAETNPAGESKKQELARGRKHTTAAGLPRRMPDC